ncbi:hypothetical protein K466DRAFT_607073 [Polyporus arcularius HHB13444]|uniref:Restriction of telomere capping protein 4 n=1 Tax=Polyporus arcularius HHB13444 TaxID=1314778 RepID=A0A5C3NMA4_9APHY|nr:hypothetical protein K466DRAFT_607073 [Polyporus arcularius HHB13444]
MTASRSTPKFTAAAADMEGAEDSAQEWPGSFTVRRIVEGFHAMDNASKEHRSGKLTVAASFAKVFDLPFKRATFYDNQKIWREAPERLRARFMRYDSLKKGSWGAFVRAVKRWDPEAPDSSSESDSDGPAWTPVFAADIAKSPTQAPATHDDIEYIDVSSAPSSPLPRNVPPSSESQTLATQDDLERINLDIRSASTYARTVSSSPPTSSASVFHDSLTQEERDEMEQDPDADANLESASSAGGTPAPPEADLCPFCDRALPSQPSKMLQEMLIPLMKRSWPDPQRKNAGRRDYEILEHDKLFRPYCEAHTRERRLEELSICNNSGQSYPPQLSFSSLPQRIAQLLPVLVNLIRDPHGDSLYAEAHKTYVPHAGIRASMRTLGQATAGYYGDKGYAIMQLILLQLLRPRFISNPLLVHELDADTFISKVLVPWLAAELIREDRGCTHADALNILFSSSRFGKEAYPLEDEYDMDTHAEAGAEMAKVHATVLLALDNVTKRSTPSASQIRNTDDPTAVPTPPASQSTLEVSRFVVIKQEEVEAVIPVSGSSAGSDWPGFKLSGVTKDGKPCYELLSDED